jgi:hypothetical protein
MMSLRASQWARPVADHEGRLVAAVIGQNICRLYHAWKTGGAAAFEQVIRDTRNLNGSDEDESKSSAGACGQSARG